MDGHSPVSTLLGTSPPPFLSLGDACDVSKTSIRSSPDASSSEDSASDAEQRIIKTKTSEKTRVSASPSLAARRARVLGANVTTMDSSLPAIVAGKGCRLFAEVEVEEEESAAAAAAAAAAAGTEGVAAAAANGGGTRSRKKKTFLVPYLDCQNNVAHLGHSHPAVSLAVSHAFSTLNTNSRYLHPDLVEHAEQLTELLSSSSSTSSSFVDDPVVYYVPSGTEANDLALRISRAFHEEAAEEELAAAAKKGREEEGEGEPLPPSEEEEEEGEEKEAHRHHYLALEGAYHGHAGEPARVSSYVHFGGAVGSRCPAEVSLLKLPDSVRDGGDNEKANSSSSSGPAAAVRAAARNAREASSSSSSSSLTAFIFEAFPSCAGQVLLPRDWLRAAVAAARDDAAENDTAPPVIIADEVQTGLGRLGPLDSGSFWAFQHFEIPNPDIVTIGKPAANGFPFGAVVASRRVAAAFARRHPPFFSTFGGCTAAAAAALATLRALQGERLPERAAEVGSWLLAELKKMAKELLLAEGNNAKLRRSNLKIDVRGVGLMLGVEVAFGASRNFAAAPRVAAFVAAHCRNSSKVLISCDGAGVRKGSVLKIKPPMCFGFEDARELVAAMRAGFEAVPEELLLLPVG